MTAKVSAALVAIQGDLRNPAKDKTADTGTYSYKYADLASILDLLRPIYAQTAAYGHFGRELADFTWERADRTQALAAAVKG